MEHIHPDIYGRPVDCTAALMCHQHPNEGPHHDPPRGLPRADHERHRDLIYPKAEYRDCFICFTDHEGPHHDLIIPTSLTPAEYGSSCFVCFVDLATTATCPRCAATGPRAVRDAFRSPDQG